MKINFESIDDFLKIIIVWECKSKTSKWNMEFPLFASLCYLVQTLFVLEYPNYSDEAVFETGL